MVYKTVALQLYSKAFSMITRLFGFSMVVLTACALPIIGADEKKKKGDDDSSDRINFSLLQPGMVQGKVKAAPNGKSIVIEIPFTRIEKKNNDKNDKDDKNDNNNKNKKNKNTKGNKNPQAAQAQRIREQIQKANQQQLEALRNQKVVIDWKEIEIPLDASTKFRSKEPGSGFDEKGNIKKYSSEELKQLKGSNPNLPGYEAKQEEIQAGQIVTINLARKASSGDDKKESSKLIPTYIISTGTYNTPKTGPGSPPKTKK